MQSAFEHIRLRELNSNESLAAACEACGHRITLLPQDLPTELDQDTELIDLEKRLRRALCGNRGRATMSLIQRRR